MAEQAPEFTANRLYVQPLSEFSGDSDDETPSEPGAEATTKRPVVRPKPVTKVVPSGPISAQNWNQFSKCNGDYDNLYVRGAEQNKAKAICIGCPAVAFCLFEALDNQIEWGIWGGLTERERRKILRNGDQWRPLLLAELAKYR